MATVLDLGLLKDFSGVFAWLLIFAVAYGVLQVADVFKNKGINSLVAVAITILVASTTGTTQAIITLIPWFVILGFFGVFLLVLANFMGIPIQQSFFSGGAGAYWIFIPLLVGLVLALISSGQISKGATEIDPETGETIATPGQTLISVVTEPKVLGFILILAISSVTIALMAGVPKAVS